MLLRNIWLSLLLALWCVAGAALPIASVELRHAYGKAITRTAADQTKAITSNLRYPGQYWDAETGLHYNDRRYYDPETGRTGSPRPRWSR